MAQNQGMQENASRQQQQQQFRPTGGGAQSNESGPGNGSSSSPAINISAIAMRGFGQFYDLQAAAARMVLQSQARAATAFGLPDYSHLFQVGDDRTKRAFSTTTEQLLNTAEQTKETIQEVQREVGRLMEFQAVSATENWQQALQELGSQAEENLNQLREFARQQTEQVMQASESLNDVTRQSIREGGQQLRDSIRQGGEQGREAAGQQSQIITNASQEAQRGMSAGGQGGQGGQGAHGAGSEEETKRKGK